MGDSKSKHSLANVALVNVHYKTNTILEALSIRIINWEPGKWAEIIVRGSV
jgi:hypothetical protein